MAATTKASTTGRTHPAKHMDGLYTASGVLAYLRSGQRHDQSGADATHEAAQTLYKAIKASSKLPYGVDKLMAARRVRKAMKRVAAAREEAARASSAASAIFIGAVGDPRSVKAAGKRGLDPTR